MGSLPENDEPTFTIVSISYAGEGDRYLLELFDSKIIEAARKEKESRRARWDNFESTLEPEGIFPFSVQSHRVFLPVTNREFQMLAPFVGMKVRVNVLAVGA